ncbi:hypothetical protein FIBSPDRAFT_929505 [Athelia psychrophila]|uniref:Uncharacterized protein n=1 Tax=Athelia psychrophila TaxID=1759441 RepID=A0A166NEA3_9AGAM|nr:hypothetical protein FIBSPDRAFT_929505 [Fibularhizoctonia sp. CBS 109695]
MFSEFSWALLPNENGLFFGVVYLTAHANESAGLPSAAWALILLVFMAMQSGLTLALHYCEAIINTTRDEHVSKQAAGGQGVAISQQSPLTAALSSCRNVFLLVAKLFCHERTVWHLNAVLVGFAIITIQPAASSYFQTLRSEPIGTISGIVLTNRMVQQGFSCLGQCRSEPITHMLFGPWRMHGREPVRLAVFREAAIGTGMEVYRAPGHMHGNEIAACNGSSRSSSRRHPPPSPRGHYDSKAWAPSSTSHSSSNSQIQDEHTATVVIGPPRGCAIQLRLTAEESAKDFRLSSAPFAPALSSDTVSAGAFDLAGTGDRTHVAVPLTGKMVELHPVALAKSGMVAKGVTIAVLSATDMECGGGAARGDISAEGERVSTWVWWLSDSRRCR